MTRPSLTGKAAVVTGGSRGIGLAIGAALVGHGVDVLLTARDRDALDAARRQLEGSGPGRVETAQTDVRNLAEVEQVMAAAAARFGGLDILINNAGVGGFTGIADMTPDEWDAVIGTNLTGVFYCCHAAVPYLRRRGGGWIINISSLAGKNSFAGGGAYCASKAGLNAFSEVLMQELRYDDIRVSYVMPGSVRTGFDGGEVDPAAGDWKLSPDDVARVVMDLLQHDTRSLPSRVEIRPSKPRK